MRHALITILALVPLLLAPRALEAQQIPSPIRYVETTQSLGAYGGYLFTDAGDPDVGPLSGPVFGVRYNLRFTGPLSGEAALGFAPTNRNVYAMRVDPAIDPTQALPLPTGETTPMTMLLAEAGLRFHLTGPRTWNNLAPFLVATGGLAADLSGRAGEEEDEDLFRLGPSFAIGVGLGTDLFLTDRLSLRFEARDHILRLPIPQEITQTAQTQTQWTNNFAFTLGAALHF